MNAHTAITGRCHYLSCSGSHDQGCHGKTPCKRMIGSNIHTASAVGACSNVLIVLVLVLALPHASTQIETVLVIPPPGVCWHVQARCIPQAMHHHKWLHDAKQARAQLAILNMQRLDPNATLRDILINPHTGTTCLGCQHSEEGIISRLANASW